MIRMIILLTSFWIIINEAQKVEITPIYTEHGYSILKLEERPIVDSYSKILHIIDLREFENVLDILKTNIKRISLNDSDSNFNLLEKEMKILERNIKSLIPHTHRSKRGLLNIAGNALKFLAGTMDSEDASEIYGHLENLNTNTKQLVDQSNKQIVINHQLTNSIEEIKNHINGQKAKFDKYFSNSINMSNAILRKLSVQQYELQTYAAISHLNTLIDKIKDNILLSRQNLLAHDILTADEIQKFNITINILPFIRNSVILKDENSIIFVILIPEFSKIKYFNALILPFPNSKNEQLSIENEKVIISKEHVFNFNFNIINKNQLKYHKNKCIRNLLSNQSTCNFVLNKEKIVEEVETGIIITKNIGLTQMKNDCSNQEIVLKGNNLIKFSNCKITINNSKFVNIIEKVESHIIIPSLNFSLIKIIENVTLENLKTENIKNRESIDYVEFKHNTISYSLSAIILIIILAVIIILKLVLTNYKNKVVDVVKLSGDSTTNINKADTAMFSETENSKRGSVIFSL